MTIHLTCDNTSIHCASINELLTCLQTLEKTMIQTHRTRLKILIDGDSEALLPQLVPFIGSRERRVAIECHFSHATPKILVQFYHAQCERLEIERLLPFAPIRAQRSHTRRTKVFLQQGTGGQGLTLAMQQQQQQQQQQVVTQSKGVNPKPLPKRKWHTVIPVDEPLGTVVHSENLEAEMGEHWNRDPRRAFDSLKSFWQQLVGDVEVIERTIFFVPTIQAIQKTAFQVMLDHIYDFSGGVVPHNLPAGFFWHREMRETLNSRWVLCFSFQKGLSYRPQPVNPLTMTWDETLESAVGDRKRANESGIDSFRITVESIIASQSVKRDHWNERKELSQEEQLTSYDQRINARGNPIEEQLRALLECARELTDDTMIARSSLEYLERELRQLVEAQRSQQNNHLFDTISGMGQVLFSHGVLGVAILVERVQRLITIDQWSCFSRSYTPRPENYPDLLLPQNLAALDHLLHLPRDIAEFWWVLVERLSEKREFIGNLEKEVAAFRYFQSEVQRLFVDTAPAWSRAIIWMRCSPHLYPRFQPLQVTLDRALFLLQQAAFPKEQLECFSSIPFHLPVVYFASQQGPFRLISFSMKVKNWSLDQFRQGRFLSTLTEDGDQFMTGFARLVAQQEWRAGSWGQYQNMSQSVERWATQNTLPQQADSRRLIALIFYASVGQPIVRQGIVLKSDSDDLLATIDGFLRAHPSVPVTEFISILCILFSHFEFELDQKTLGLKELIQLIGSLTTLTFPPELECHSLKQLMLLMAFYGDLGLRLVRTFAERINWSRASTRHTHQQFDWQEWWEINTRAGRELRASGIEKIEQLFILQLLVLSEIYRHDTADLLAQSRSQLMDSLKKLLMALGPEPSPRRQSVLQRLTQIDKAKSQRLWSGELYGVLEVYFREHFGKADVSDTERECELMHVLSSKCGMPVLLPPSTRLKVREHTLFSALRREVSNSGALVRVAQLELRAGRGQLKSLLRMILTDTDLQLKRTYPGAFATGTTDAAQSDGDSDEAVPSDQTTEEQQIGFLKRLLDRMIVWTIKTYYLGYQNDVRLLMDHFDKTPYSFPAIAPALRTLGARFQSHFSEIKFQVPLQLFRQVGLIVAGRMIKPKVVKLFPSDFPADEIPDFSSFLRGITAWLLELPKSDLMSSVRPAIEAVFSFLAWFESLVYEPSLQVLAELVLRLTQVQQVVRHLFRHQIAQRTSPLAWLEKLSTLLQGSYLDQTLQLVIRLLTRDEDVLSYGAPVLMAYVELLDELQQDAADPARFYEKLNVFECVIVSSYHQFCDAFGCHKAFKELHTWVLMLEKEALEERHKRECVWMQARGRELPAAVDFDAQVRSRFRSLEWFGQPTKSIVLFYRDEMIQHYRSIWCAEAQIVGGSDLLGEETVRRVRNLGYHFLEQVGTTVLPIGDLVYAYEKRYRTLSQLGIVLQFYSDNLFPSEAYQELVHFVLTDYEAQGNLEALIYLLDVLSLYPDGQNQVLFTQMVLKEMCPITLPKLPDPRFTAALKALEGAFKDPSRPDTLKERESFYLLALTAPLSSHAKLPIEKLQQWRAVPNVVLAELNALIEQMIASLLTGRKSDLVPDVMVFLDRYLGICPEIVNCLAFMFNQPDPKALWERFPEDQAEAICWIRFIIHMGAGVSSRADWDLMVEVLRQEGPLRQELMQPYLYAPFPNIAVYASIVRNVLRDRNERGWLRYIEQHPCWAMRISELPKKTPVVSGLFELRREEELLRAAIRKIQHVSTGTFLPDHLVLKMEQDGKTLLRFKSEYSSLTRHQLQGLEQGLRDSLQSHNVDPHLRWLACVEVIMYRTCGVFPNAVQDLAVLWTWHSQEKNVALGLETGQGKTFIAALCAVWEWARRTVPSHSVTVMIPNHYLITQAFETNHLNHFFAFLRIPAKVLVFSETSTYPRGMIVYATPHEVAFTLSRSRVSVATLQSHSNDFAVLLQEVLGTVLIDEFDLLFALMMLFKFVRSPGANRWDWVYPLVLAFVRRSDFQQIAGDLRIVWDKETDIDHLVTSIRESCLTPEQRDQWDHLEQQTQLRTKVNGWIDSACTALQLVERTHFHKMSDEVRQGHQRAVPLVHSVPQFGSEFSESVHCFITLLLQQQYPQSLLEMPQESQCIDVFSPLELVRLFGRLICLSASFGEDDQRYLRGQIGLEGVRFPLYQPSKRYDFPPILCQNNQAQVVKIRECIRTHLVKMKNAPILMIGRDANWVRRMHAALSVTPLTNQQGESVTLEVFLGDETEAETQQKLQRATQPKTVTIAPISWGRGVNLREQNILVICGNLFTKETTAQIYGRVGRYGLEGFTISVLDASEIGLESVVSKYQAFQMEAIQKAQDALAIAAAVERYYFESSSSYQAACLARFDEWAALLYRHVLPDQIGQLNQWLVVYRSRWLEHIHLLWKQGVEALDPNHQYPHPYVRRGSNGNLDLAPLDHFLTHQYVEQLNQAWQQLTEEVEQKISECMPILDADALGESCWIRRELTDTLSAFLTGRAVLSSCTSAPGFFKIDTGFSEQRVERRVSSAMMQLQRAGVAAAEPPRPLSPVSASHTRLFDAWRHGIDMEKQALCKKIRDLDSVLQKEGAWSSIPLEWLPENKRSLLKFVRQIDDDVSEAGQLKWKTPGFSFRLPQTQELDQALDMYRCVRCLDENTVRSTSLTHFELIKSKLNNNESDKRSLDEEVRALMQQLEELDTAIAAKSSKSPGNGSLLSRAARTASDWLSSGESLGEQREKVQTEFEKKMRLSQSKIEDRQRLQKHFMEIQDDQLRLLESRIKNSFERTQEEILQELNTWLSTYVQELREQLNRLDAKQQRVGERQQAEASRPRIVFL